MLWAQSHLAGYEMLKAHPELRERLEELLGEEMTVDSHAVEYVGVYFSWNHVDDGDPMLAAIHEVMSEEFEITMTDPPLRPTIRELLVTFSEQFVLAIPTATRAFCPRVRLEDSTKPNVNCDFTEGDHR